MADEGQSDSSDAPANRRGQGAGTPEAVARRGDSWQGGDETGGGQEGMSFLDHLEELRGVLVKSVLAFLVAALLIVFFMKDLAALMVWPMETALGERADDFLRDGLQLLRPMAVFSVIVQVTLIGSLALSLPFILYFVARFISPGLTPRELRILRPACISAFCLFLFGAAFSFTILVPSALRASIYLSDMMQLRSNWTADAYYGLVTWMTIGVGILFEFPLVLIALVSVGVVNTRMLRHYWRHAFVGFLCLAAVVTPTADPITFLILAAPMMILYEASIVFGRIIERRKREEEESI